MAYDTDVNGVPILEPKSLLTDVPSYTQAVAPYLVDVNGNDLSSLADRVELIDQHLALAEAALEIETNYPIITGGWVMDMSGNPLHDGEWRRMNTHALGQYGVPAAVGDLVVMYCTYYRGTAWGGGNSTNVTRPTITTIATSQTGNPNTSGAGQSLGTTKHQDLGNATWFFPPGMHGSFGPSAILCIPTAADFANGTSSGNLDFGIRAHAPIRTHDYLTCHSIINFGKSHNYNVGPRTRD